MAHSGDGRSFSPENPYHMHLLHNELRASFRVTGAQLVAWALQLQQTLREEREQKGRCPITGERAQVYGWGLKLQSHRPSHLTACRVAKWAVSFPFTEGETRLGEVGSHRERG